MAANPLTHLEEDSSVLIAAVAYGCAMSLLVLFLYIVNGTYSVLPFFCLLGLFIHLVAIRRSLSDPFALLLLFGFIYSAFPILFGRPYSWDALEAGFDGAAIIYAVGSISLLFGIAFAIILIPATRPRRRLTESVGGNPVSFTAGICMSSLSISLTLLYISSRGSVLGGDVSYGDSFQLQMQAGTGILLLSVPFAAGGISLMLTSNVPLRWYHHAVGLSAYAGMYFAQGQRKYMIIPAVLYLAHYYRLLDLRRFVAILLGCSGGLLLFMYLGFLRTQEYSLGDALEPHILGEFLAEPEALGGESVTVFATATSAYEGFVTALPYGGDYLLSWMMCLPQFVFGEPFVPMNVRFARAYSAETAVTGQGFGFSFFGEAFLIGGYPMILFATFLMMVFFRWLYVFGGSDNRSGPWGAVSLSVTPFTFWFQRNAAAYFVKEFLVLQVGTIVLAYYLVNSMMQNSPIASAVDDTPAV